jgi:hypothetical protein
VGRHLQIAIDCADPDLLAEFWIEALGYAPYAPPDGSADWAAFSAKEAHDPGERWRIIGDPDMVGPPVLFHTVAEAKVVKNRVHLDVSAPRDGSSTDDIAVVEAEASRLMELGARRLRSGDDDGGFYIVMEDPEGNEFCLA